MTEGEIRTAHSTIAPPDHQTSRQVGFDVARALAVIGMVIVNFKVVLGADKQGADWLVWLVGLLDGRAAATFVILAGVGISLLSRRARKNNDPLALAEKRKTLLKRALFLFCFGLIYAPVWPADILHFYGIYLLLGAVLINASDRNCGPSALRWPQGLCCCYFSSTTTKGGTGQPLIMKAFGPSGV